MGAIVTVGEERVLMSTGAAEALRRGLVTYLRERGEDREPLGARVVAALELMWPADLADDGEPYDDPATRDLLAPAWEALARDAATPEPRLLSEVSWDRLDRATRIWWIAILVRIARAWSGVDLSREHASDWPAGERATLDSLLAETAIMRTWGRFYDAPSAAHRDALEAALGAQARIARGADLDFVASIASAHAAIGRRAAVRAAEHR